MVVVQPSPYGTDNWATLDVVENACRHRGAAVGVIDDNISAAALRDTNDAATRGMRFNPISGNGTPADRLRTTACRLAPFGRDIQLYATGETMLELAS